MRARAARCGGGVTTPGRAALWAQGRAERGAGMDPDLKARLRQVIEEQGISL